MTNKIYLFAVIFLAILFLFIFGVMVITENAISFYPVFNWVMSNKTWCVLCCIWLTLIVAKTTKLLAKRKKYLVCWIFRCENKFHKMMVMVPEKFAKVGDTIIYQKKRWLISSIDKDASNDTKYLLKITDRYV